MIQWLTYIGLAIIPFTIVNGGSRWPKEYLATGLAAAIGCWALSRGLFKPIKNTFMFVTLFFMLAGTAFVPPSGVVLGFKQQNTFLVDSRLDIDNLWNYKPILYAVLFLLMVCALSSIKIENINDYLLIMAWVGGIMAIIALLQHLGFTQFWYPKFTSEIGSVKNPEMTSFIGQPTLTAAFVAMCLLPALYLQKWYLAGIMAICVIVTGSAFGLLAITAALLLYLARKRLSFFIGAIFLTIIVALVMFFIIKFDAHGRTSVWIQAINDLKRPMEPGGIMYGFTGYGAGAYHYANQLMHGSPWAQAHNEFIEFMFNNGTIGILLLLGAIGTFFRSCLQSFYNQETYLLMSMFIVACIIACGTFIWQLGVTQFYTATILGLAYNRLNQEQAWKT